jgi:hypothetical protein
MSKISITQYETAAQQFFRQNPKSFEKFYSQTLLQTLVDAMQSGLPTVTTAKITFDRLVRNGTLQRTDGRTERDDNAAVLTAAEANLERVLTDMDAAPLLKSELEYFGSLSQSELSRLYYGPDGDAVCEFAVRYRKANREFGFVIPQKFGNQAANESGEIQLTAAEYHAMDSRILQTKLREPRFKAAVYRLIQQGKI